MFKETNKIRRHINELDKKNLKELKAENKELKELKYKNKKLKAEIK